MEHHSNNKTEYENEEDDCLIKANININNEKGENEHLYIVGFGSLLSGFYFIISEDDQFNKLL